MSMSNERMTVARMTTVTGPTPSNLDRERGSMTSVLNFDANGEDRASRRTSLRSAGSDGSRSSRPSTVELIEEEPYIPPPQTFFFVVNKEGVKTVFNIECRVGPFLKYMKKYMGMCDEEQIDFCDFTGSKFQAIFREDTHSYLSESFQPLNIYIPCRITTDLYGSADFVQPIPNDWREKYRYLHAMMTIFLDNENSRTLEMTKPARNMDHNVDHNVDRNMDQKGKKNSNKAKAPDASSVR